MIECRAIAIGSPEHDAALRLRAAVLRAPLGLTWTATDVADEPVCLHLGAFEGETLVAVLLLKPRDNGTMKMRQVAVDPQRQGQQVGAKLIAFAEKVAREQGCHRMIAHARATALGFYRRLGYAEEGEGFLENTIPHQRVWKEL
jgi:GNAT superfamily N-acetyltransferase